MSTADHARLRKRPATDNLPDPSEPGPSRPLTYPTSPSRRFPSKALLGLLSLGISSYIIYSKIATPPDHVTLNDAFAVCSRQASQIYSVDPANPRPQCLLVHRSKYLHTGSLDDVHARWRQTSTKTLQVRYLDPGQIVVPGMSDSHAHTLEYGATKQMPLEGTSTVAETVQRVKAYVLADPDINNDKSKYVQGWGWDHTNWLPAQWPTYRDFEAVPLVAGRPIVLQSKDGHALWVSQAVLNVMEPLPDAVEGGVIVRDSDGKPTGVFLDNAQELVIRPDPTHKELQKRFKATVKDAHSYGLTSIHDAGFHPQSIEFFRREARAGVLPLRIYGMKYFDETAAYWGDSFKKIVRAGNNRLSVRSVKIFADGAMRSGGAALCEPYADNPETSGFMRIAPEVLNEIIPKFMADGWQVNVHAIGDCANRVVLDAFEAALSKANVTALRPRLEHAQVLAQRDMARFGNLGVIASVQPTHVISDMWFAEDRLGPERVKGLYAFRSIIDHGARITLGTDFPVEDMNPLNSFYAAITRVSPAGTSPHGPGGWFPEQRMTRSEALRGITIDPAYASFTDDILGSITPGKIADFVVLSDDIMRIAPEKVLKTRVVATFMDGRPVYGAV